MKSIRKTLISQRLSWYETIDSTFLSLSKESRLKINRKEELLHEEKDKLLDIYYNGAATEEIENRVIDIDVEIEHIKNEIESLLEMEVIYIYKSYEYNLKQILTLAFQDTSPKNASHWGNVVKFLDKKGVDVMSCSGFQEFIEFKKLNNEIKHEAFAQSKSLNALGCVIKEDFENYVSNSKASIEAFLQDLNRKVKVVLANNDSPYMNEVLEGIEVLKYYAASGKRYT
ncbi:hypothetical protein RH728_004180 [Vibrio vulnificus]|uniref:hypothetical protein n=1 Tax=Vibrio anguillarum TaxID=55601 RepID=UPI000B53F74E|nr:hypothetical protein [Vibrio anguillarum]ASG09255.1 hypothetical protein CEQ50_17350 [Vibrio anguillarum]EHK9050405.1 hypothetical protein [Vibrio vulnificus]EKA6052427.1 hypothetical protein [Vibrio vulnificus]ELB7645986.1 hypothetical protein [Vibrio vulnificus]